MDLARPRLLVIWLAAGIIFDLLLVVDRNIRVNLGSTGEMTGYWLFGVMVFLALFHLRKRLSMLPLGGAAVWLNLHAVGGVLVLLIYWLHTGSLWPNGIYEYGLAVLFYLTALSGIVGYFIQRVYPRMMTQTGIEVIYERIPAHLSDLREEAKRLVVECCDRTRVDTLGRYYLNTLDWYFRRPRFGFNHVVGSQRSRQWLRQQDAYVRHYLNDEEKAYLDRLTKIARQKDKIDLHYALQSVMKRWLLVHIPLTAALMTLALWHLLVANVYAL